MTVWQQFHGRLSQKNFSQIVGFFAEAKDVGENEEENQPKVSFVGQSIVAAGNAGSTLLKIDFKNSNNNALYVQIFDLNNYKIVLSENKKRKKYKNHFYIIFCNYRL